MNRYLIATFLLVYLLSCSTGDKNEPGARVVRASLSFDGAKDKSHLSKISSFSDFLKEMSRDQMIASGDENLQDLAKYYFPDSTVTPGFDLHAREIGNIDSFRLVFYEYFDLYSPEYKTWLGIFTPAGQARAVQSIRNVSFEGNVSVNILDKNLLEITYYDFFDTKKAVGKSIIPNVGFYIRPFEKKKDVLEGFIYEYYQVDTIGRLNNLESETSLSFNRLFPQASARILSLSELEPLSYEELSLVKNEILADHGFIFMDADQRLYFSDQTWYNPRFNDVEAFLSPIEKINIQKLEKLEQQY